MVSHVVYVAVSPAGRGDLVLHGRILCRQSERVPAHRLQDVFAQHTLKAGDGISDRIVAHVPHVQMAAGIGEHGQAVEFLFVRVFRGFEGAVGVPVGLSLSFHLLWIVGKHVVVGHGSNFCVHGRLWRLVSVCASIPQGSGGR